MEDQIKTAAEILIGSQAAIALTGAGMSTESGIPDFRGPSGIWTRDPEAEKRAYRSYDQFQKSPKKYWEERLTGPSLLGDLSQAAPNAGHLALFDLEKMGILKWVITQNIDNLHQKAGNRKVLDYHGNAFKLRCASCLARYEPEDFDLLTLLKQGQLPPLCRKCGGAIKSDIVHFHEPIPADVSTQSLEIAIACDAMLICGTSAVVYPFANLPRIAKRLRREKGLPFTLIEINAEPTPLTEQGISNDLLQGKTGEILPRLVAEIRKVKLTSKKPIS
jgi:NAD-dependent deacetylase